MTPEILELLLEYIDAKAIREAASANGQLVTEEIYKITENHPDKLRAAVLQNSLNQGVGVSS